VKEWTGGESRWKNPAVLRFVRLSVVRRRRERFREGRGVREKGRGASLRGGGKSESSRVPREPPAAGDGRRPAAGDGRPAPEDQLATGFDGPGFGEL
jgi:hypothetical protein